MPLTVYLQGQYVQFNTIDQNLADALQHGPAVRPDGTPYVVTTFLGGYLLDGCPLNVILGQGWLQGQVDALKSAGILPTCLIPGTKDYADFYGTQGAPAIPPPSTIPPPPGTAYQTPSAPPAPIAPGVPPTIQVTEPPYNPPLQAGDVIPPSTGPFGLEWSTIAIIAIGVWFLWNRKGY